MTNTITTELRKSMVDDARGLLYIGETALADLCDAIDAVHANLERENESLRRELDRVLGEQEDRDGFVRLPKDADGEYIHFGDVLDQFGTPMTVFAMSDPDPGQGDCMLELITDGISDGTWVRARKMRHYHAPTVEDVLREFAAEVCGEPALTIRIGVVEEYAAKLRLAGEN